MVTPAGPVISNAIAGSGRFVVLDSLRGVCACIVVLFHFENTGVVTGSALIRQGWMFVDFFFVLSGFVIAAGYGKRLAEGFSIRSFMLLRLGRIYPLHAVMLVAFAAIELVAFALAAGGAQVKPGFSPPHSIGALFESFALFQIFGFDDSLTWNPPSWSIAAEIWAYLLAGLMLRFASRWRVPLLALAVCGAVLALGLWGDAWLDRTYSFGLVRCIYGFGLGMLCWELYRAGAVRMDWPGHAATLAELAIVIAVGALVVAAGKGPLTLAGPPLFLAAVLVFSRERGAVSRLLQRAPFVLLGTLSYSIYMIHHFIQSHVMDVFTLVRRTTGIQLVEKIETPHGMVAMVTGPGLVADLVALLMLALVIGLAWFSYRLIEEPFRRWSRAYAARRGAGAAEQIAPAL